MPYLYFIDAGALESIESMKFELRKLQLSLEFSVTKVKEVGVNVLAAATVDDCMADALSELPDTAIIPMLRKSEINLKTIVCLIISVFSIH